MRASPGMILLSVAATVVVASIIAGVVLVGGPASGRLESLDDNRIEDLQGTVRAIDRFWNDHERLPTTLQELAKDPRVRVNTLDPGSGEAYEYRVLDDDTYELCAVFEYRSQPPLRAPADFWRHGVGAHCFEVAAKPTGSEPTGPGPVTSRP